MERDSDNILAFIRVSRPNHNRDVCENHILYMNSQVSFDGKGLTRGQYDDTETTVYMGLMNILCSSDAMKSWQGIPFTVTNMKYNPYAFIFCVHMVLQSKLKYDETSQRYLYIVPWEYIRGFCKPNQENELLVILNTPAFTKGFEQSAEAAGYTPIYGEVFYDLEERAKTQEYVKQVFCEPLTVVFHKESDHSKDQEFRFAVLDSSKPPHIELPFYVPDELSYHYWPVRENCSIGIWFEGLQFEEGTKLKFANRIQMFYIPEAENDD